MKTVTINVDVYSVGPGENIIILSSGYEGVKIAVAEDCGYNVSAWYPTENQMKEIIELDRKMGEFKKE